MRPGGFQVTPYVLRSSVVNLNSALFVAAVIPLLQNLSFFVLFVSLPSGHNQMPDRAVARSSMSQEGLGALLVRRGPFLNNDEVDSDEGVRRDPFLDSATKCPAMPDRPCCDLLVQQSV